MQSYPFHGRQVHVVVNGAFPRFQQGDSIHFFFGQCKVENVEVLYHPCLAYGLGNDHDVALIEPTEYDRSHAFTMPCGDFFQYRMVENVVLPFGKRCPCFMLDSLLLQEGIGGLLLEKRMCFKLVYGRVYFVVQKQSCNRSLEKLVTPIARMHPSL